MQEEPSILASLGIDPAGAPPPPDAVWDAAMRAAFDPSSTADPDTVPDMDDTPPSPEEADDEQLVVDPAVDHAPDDHDVAPAPDVTGPDEIALDDADLHESDLDAAETDEDLSAGDAGPDPADAVDPHDGHYEL
ncbi:hypothetical protein GIY30_09335 [Gordonia sp. HNM0687]|uniref:Uncharacterized protein n=1 Tax=Gordonia mangrovi TaxID=2665643 RepID=A0A6L7GPK7_9ACTN|nr:hypothetical protein [Gordonia mangrovi]MXP21552.1 hypothetical protein [Gordonia mangrovi]UVF80295.1 hypothetical protein NWF22_10930 [Gordonia mangrovi]